MLLEIEYIFVSFFAVYLYFATFLRGKIVNSCQKQPLWPPPNLRVNPKAATPVVFFCKVILCALTP